MALIQSQKDGHYFTFDDVKHKYTLDGEAVPGVTTFIKGGYPQSFNLTSWMIGQGASYTSKVLQRIGREKPLRIGDKLNEKIAKKSKTAYKKLSEEAAGIGSVVHDYAYLTEIERTSEAMQMLSLHKETPQWERIKNGVDKFEDWRKENKDELVDSEQIVASIQHSFGGKFDRLARRDGVLILSDFKTSNGIYPDQFIQLAAYRLAIKEWLGLDVKMLEILRFGKDDGDFHTLLIDKPSEIEMFTEQAIRCRQTYQFRKVESDKRFKFGGKNV